MCGWWDLAALQIASTDGKYGDRGFTKDTLRKKKKTKNKADYLWIADNECSLQRTEAVRPAFF